MVADRKSRIEARYGGHTVHLSHIVIGSARSHFPVDTLLGRDDSSKIEKLEGKLQDAFDKGEYLDVISCCGQLEKYPGRELFDHELYYWAVAHKMRVELNQAKEQFQRVKDNAETSIYDTLADLQIPTILYLEGDIEQAMEKFSQIYQESFALVEKHLDDKTFIGLGALVKLYSKQKQITYTSLQ